MKKIQIFAIGKADPSIVEFAKRAAESAFK